MTNQATLPWPTHSRELRALVNDNYERLFWVPQELPDPRLPWAERMEYCAKVEAPGPLAPEALARRYPWVTFNLASAALEHAAQWPDDDEAQAAFWRTCLTSQPFLGTQPRLARYIVHARKTASEREAHWLTLVAENFERRLAALPLVLPLMPFDATVTLYWRLRGELALDVARHGIQGAHVVSAAECLLTCGILTRAGAADAFSAWDGAGTPKGALSILADRDRNADFLVEQLMGRLLRQPLSHHTTLAERACLPLLWRLRRSDSALHTGCAFDVLSDE